MSSVKSLGKAQYSSIICLGLLQRFRSPSLRLRGQSLRGAGLCECCAAHGHKQVPLGFQAALREGGQRCGPPLSRHLLQPVESFLHSGMARIENTSWINCFCASSFLLLQSFLRSHLISHLLYCDCIVFTRCGKGTVVWRLGGTENKSSTACSGRQKMSCGLQLGQLVDDISAGNHNEE